MAKINLLPPDLGPNASVLKFLNLAKKIAVIIGSAFFVFGLLLIGYIVFLRIQIQASAKRSEGLKNSITALKSTEQSLYLLKERTGKIKELLAKETQEDSLAGSSSVLINHPGVTLTQVTASPGKINISAGSQKTGDLNSFFENILSDNNYQNIKLTSFMFNPKTGYIFGLELNLK
ncbi:hypothetical protein COX03_03615 [Candidatus Woesebacteria bacterium CG22_combo_CG10-13_8_21_14_all_39_10]|uniref:Fimbrial assembly protein n=2 Tax=Candidatus Woeseibacteriota TaxID=1752722 RepID=A0A2M7AQ06_9BACT|nr:MAG: hypothetical protein COX03_03615 [Candidatus Woesebacteria bacterium CG22_combo_CG10-13_8_21_14_all_39_10]PIU71721.1 MAG: hypothetical protein COS80_01735 [Candidatus Woesebacteria bacterium CG06_land_8_20_14_3_00_39_27]